MVLFNLFSRSMRVFIDNKAFERFKTRDTRYAVAIEDLSDAWAAALGDVDLSHLPD